MCILSKKFYSPKSFNIFQQKFVPMFSNGRAIQNLSENFFFFLIKDQALWNISENWKTTNGQYQSFGHFLLKRQLKTFSNKIKNFLQWEENNSLKGFTFFIFVCFSTLKLFDAVLPILKNTNFNLSKCIMWCTYCF